MGARGGRGAIIGRLNAPEANAAARSRWHVGLDVARGETPDKAFYPDAP